MTKVIRKEIRKRSAMGKIIKWTFIGFNILMLIWFIGGMGAAGEVASDAASDAEQAGAVIGTTLAAGMLLTLWAIGDVILGILVLLTRGEKTIIDETIVE
jgi:hypothetical protein